MKYSWYGVATLLLLSIWSRHGGTWYLLHHFQPRLPAKKLHRMLLLDTRRRPRTETDHVLGQYELFRAFVLVCWSRVALVKPPTMPPQRPWILAVFAAARAHHVFMLASDWDSVRDRVCTHLDVGGADIIREKGENVRPTLLRLRWLQLL